MFNYDVFLSNENFNENSLNTYSKYLDSNFKDQNINSQLREKEYILRPGSNGEITLSFLDNKQIKTISFHKIDRNRIQDSTGESYDSINEVLNHYQLNLLFQQKQFFSDFFKDLKRKAEEEGLSLSNEIQIYGINPSTEEGQRALIGIAKEIAQEEVGISEYIDHFCIDSNKPEGLRALIEIAELEAQRNGRLVSRFIQNYGIDATQPAGQTALIHIAKLAARQSGDGVSANIKNYGIDPENPIGQSALIEIAMVAVNNPMEEDTSEYIQDYGIDDSTPEGQAALIVIAMIAAQHNGWRPSELIKNYRINPATPVGQAALIKIALLAAANSGEGVSKYIKNYGINSSTPKGQAALIEIFNQAAQQDPAKALENIENYEIDTTKPDWRQALVVMGNKFKEGNGVPQDFNKARLFFEYAVDHGYPEVEFELKEIATEIGRTLEFGSENVAVDLTKARKYYELSVREGPYDKRDFAYYRLGRMWGLGLGGDLDRNKSIEYLRAAIAWGIPDARLDLAWQYRLAGQITLAEQCEAEYRALRFKDLKDIVDLGGELLTLSLNIPQLEEDIRLADSNMAAAFSGEVARIKTVLEATGEISQEETITPKKMGGICAGMVMEFIFELQAKPFPPSKQFLQAVADRFSKRPGVTAVALQALYLHLFYSPKLILTHMINSLPSSSSPHLPFLTQKNLRDRDLSSKQPIFHVLGQKQVVLPQLGVPGEIDELQCLSRWLKEPDGMYALGINIIGDRHDLCLIKSQSQIYLWDPNFGLIKCPTKDPETMIINFLARKYPGLPNHNLDIRRVESIRSFNTD